MVPKMSVPCTAVKVTLPTIPLAGTETRAFGAPADLAICLKAERSSEERDIRARSNFKKIFMAADDDA